MTRSRLGYLLGAAIILPVLLATGALAEKEPAGNREVYAKQMKGGNWKDAYEGFSLLALDPADDPAQVGGDLTNAVACLQNLGRQNEIDAFREKVIAAHGANWRLLKAAADSYMQTPHDGFIVASVFERGGHRGGGTYANAYERDRVRALQLMQQAMKAAEKDANKADVGAFYMNLASMLLGQRGYNEAWRLQYLTDLATLPDYEEGYYGRYGRGGSPRGAPVDGDGNPVYYHIPKSWEAATSDGKRWRWALVQAAECGHGLESTASHQLADFLLNQFGVQTMAEYRWFFGRAAEADETKKDESGTYALHTLGEDETIARLATGIKRFKLPDEFNYIRIFKELNNNQRLAQIFEDRRQYEKAAGYFKLIGATANVNQILGNWGQFEPVMTQPAGQGASVEFRFRNGRKVRFTAREIDVRKLLDDVKAYLKSGPKQLDGERMQIQDIGGRLLRENQKQYVGVQVAAWDLDLEPRPAHFDKRITVTTPLQKAGAYFLTAEMDGGNTSHIVLWVADTAIVKKALDKGTYYYVADAASGRPVAKANLEFFGYRQKSVEGPNNRTVRYEIVTRDFAEFTDADGQLILNSTQQDSQYQWLIIATTPEGRLAYLGFSGVWYGNYRDQEYN
ncbi:MAG: alpha-2-macroglobulin, partial [Acidobacteria bacterium]|nr:alpha-2-macroglobulin [Acidobacteriota bacterium]